MTEGVHYVEMTLAPREDDPPPRPRRAWMGVVGQGVDVAGDECSALFSSVEGWLLATHDGTLVHANKGSSWEGMPQTKEIKQGDVVGLLLDLGQRTLSMYLNGAWRGVMVAPWMKDNDGREVAPLVGPLVWAVDVLGGASVRIKRKPPPPSPAWD
jgi:hypothetical protein